MPRLYLLIVGFLFLLQPGVVTAQQATTGYSSALFRRIEERRVSASLSSTSPSGTTFRPFSSNTSGQGSTAQFSTYSGTGFRPFSESNSSGIFSNASYSGSSFRPFADYGESGAPAIVTRRTTRQTRFVTSPGSSTRFPRSTPPNRCTGSGPGESIDGGTFGPIPDTIYCGIFGPVPTLDEYLPRGSDTSS